MIPLSKNLTILFTSLLALLGLAMAFGMSPARDADLATLVPVVLIVELIVYFGSTMLMNSSLSLVFVALYSIVLLLARAVIALLAALFAGIIITNNPGELATDALLMGWVGEWLGVIIQVGVMMVASPHVLEMLFPNLFDEEFSKSLGSAAPVSRTVGKISDANPSGGFIQVFSYEELSGVVSKTPGLDGFVIFSREGFVVWKDLPHKIAVDQFAASIMSTSTTIDQQFKNSGFSAYRKMMIESREHLVFVSELNQNFGMILVYNNRVKLADCDQKVPVLVKTAREFLQWKYPGISLSTPMRAYSA